MKSVIMESNIKMEILKKEINALTSVVTTASFFVLVCFQTFVLSISSFGEQNTCWLMRRGTCVARQPCVLCG